MAAIAGGTALGGLPVHAAQAPAGTAAPQNDLVKGYCPFCQVRCTYHARVRNGKILELIGDRGNRWTGGAMCPKGLSIVELLNSPYRLVQPMLKQGSEWKTISYAEAVDIVVDKLRQSRAKHGDKIAERLALTSPLWDCRESELAALMTMRTAGGVNVMPAGEVCISTASNVLGMLLGANTSTTTVNEIVNAKTLVLWGANISETYPPYTRWLDKARDAGVRIVSVDCRKTPTSAWAADQLMPLPGTDGALALGAIRFVLENGAFDRARVDESITGFELMEKGAQPWSVDKVAQATGCPKTPSPPSTGRLPRAPAPSSGWAAASPATPTGCRASGRSSRFRPCATTSSARAGGSLRWRAASPKAKRNSSTPYAARPRIPASTSAACSTP